jgi:hypothetical protein
MSPSVEIIFRKQNTRKKPLGNSPEYLHIKKIGKENVRQLKE